MVVYLKGNAQTSVEGIKVEPEHEPQPQALQLKTQPRQLQAGQVQLPAPQAEVHLSSEDDVALCPSSHKPGWVLVVAHRHQKSNQIEIYDRDKDLWRQVWQRDGLPAITKMTPLTYLAQKKHLTATTSHHPSSLAAGYLAALAVGDALYLVREREHTYELQRLGQSQGEVRALALVVPSPNKTPALLYLSGGHLEQNHLRATQLFLWPLQPGGRAVLMRNIRQRHNAWDIACGDVDGDQQADVLVSMWKQTRANPQFGNRPFLYGWTANKLWPKWLGSSLGWPFLEAKLADINGNGLSELVAIEKDSQQERWRLALYYWSAFGFLPVQALTLQSEPTQLSVCYAGHSAMAPVLVKCKNKNGGEFIQLYLWDGSQVQRVWQSPVVQHAKPIGLVSDAQGLPAHVLCLINGRLLLQPLAHISVQQRERSITRINTLYQLTP